MIFSSKLYIRSALKRSEKLRLREGAQGGGVATMVANTEHNHEGDTLKPFRVEIEEDLVAGGDGVFGGEVSAVASATEGSAGTSDYLQLDNKPQIAGVVLSGNKTLAELGIQPAGDYLSTLSKSMVEAVLVGVITSHTHNYAALDHNHTGVYAAVSHTHSNYAAADHNHAGVYAAADHNHAGVYAAAEDLNNYYNKTTADARFAAINGSATQDFAANNFTAAGNIISNGEVSAVASASTGSAGTSDYSQLDNKPQIAGIVLSGNKTLADLGIQPAGDYLSALSKSMVEAVLVGEISSHSHARPSYSYSEITSVPTSFQPKTTYIGANVDLNDYTTVGFYYCSANFNAFTLSNCPTTYAFSLLVEKHAGTKQTLTEYRTTSPQTWFRNYYNNVWKDWTLIYTEVNFAISDYLTTSNASSTYLPLSGGTMTGVVNIYKGSYIGRTLFKDSGYANEQLIYNGNASKYLRLGVTDLKWGEQKVWHAGNDGSGSGLDADTLDGVHYSTISSAISTLQGYFTSGVANSATKLATARTIWGQSFDGTAAISGNMTSVGSITSIYGHVINPNYSNGGITLQLNGGSTAALILTTNYFKPFTAANGLLDLGNSTSRWNGIYGNSLKLNGAISGATTINASSNIVSSAGVTGQILGISNTNSTTGYGLSLYGGPYTSMPSYGIAFAGTSTFGTHGYVTSDWATYFTMSNGTSRGWIFRYTDTSTNVASISATGSMYLNGDFYVNGNVVANSEISAEVNSTEVVGSIKTRLTTLETQLQLIVADIETLESAKNINTSNISSLLTRVSALETRVNQL